MTLPFFRISGEVQEEHMLYGEDVSNLQELSSSMDPRVVSYCRVLRAHKSRCPLCSWPRLYPFIRRSSQFFRRMFLRKLW